MLPDGSYSHAASDRRETSGVTGAVLLLHLRTMAKHPQAGHHHHGGQITQHEATVRSACERLRNMSEWKMDKYERDLLFDLVYAQNSVLSELIVLLRIHIVKDDEWLVGRLNAMQKILNNPRSQTAEVKEN